MNLYQPFIVLFLSGLCSAPSLAQGLRVSTHISDDTARNGNESAPLLSSSLSLFHNGRVYDYVEAADEVLIYEPSSRRFTILNTARSVYTTISFDEINSLMASRGPKIQAYLSDLKASGSLETETIRESMKFQMNPEFETQYNELDGSVHMLSRSWKYHVKTREWADRDQLQHYLTYADWTARLNYILHPSSRFPEPRMALNEKLRELGDRMPVSVQLDLRPDERRVLRADHQFVNNIDDTDRALITRWEQVLQNGGLTRLTFRRYQEAVLVSQTR